MANRENGDIPYQFNGSSYTLRLDSDAMVAMETAASTGEKEITFAQVMAKAQRGSWTYQRILVWASLQAHHPEITLKQAGDLMLASAQAEVARAMTDLATSATPDPEDLKELGVPPARPPSAQGTRERARRRRGTGAPSTSPPDASV